ncbi:MAG: hypothetical protein KC620_01660 [Myxococcales bacterium]|nr:hypothetical protein [Myxococcales bacterium]
MTDALTPWRPRPVVEVFTAVRPAPSAAHEAANFEAELGAVLSSFETTDETVARTHLAQLAGLLRANEQTAARLAERGFFRTLWARLTGTMPADAEAVRTRLGEVQARALAVTERLLTRQVFLAHATHHLGGRLELLAVANVKLKAALVRLGQRVIERVEHLESRVARLERRSDGLERRIALTELFQSAFSPSAQLPYAQIEDVLVRGLTLARDFIDASGGDWRPIDLHRLRRLAHGELSLGHRDAVPLTIWVERAIEHLCAENPLAEWVRAESLYPRLMAPLDDDTLAARSFYPVHFMLQRPRWFVAQGLPASKAAGVIAEELTVYGLDTREIMSPWRFVELLLEERLAWQLEEPELPAIAGPRKTTRPTRGLAIEAMWLVDGQIVVLGHDGQDDRPVLYEVDENGPSPVHASPPVSELPLTPNRWGLGRATLWTLTADRRGALGGVRDGQPEAPWRWETIRFPGLDPLMGVAAGQGAVIAWDRTTVYRRRDDGRPDSVPRPVVDADLDEAGVFLLLDDHLQRWGDEGVPLEWAALPRGLRGMTLRLAPGSDALPIVRCRDQEGRESLVVPGPHPAVLPIDAGASFAALPGGRVAVCASGLVTIWDRRSGTARRGLPGVPEGAQRVAADRTHLAVFCPAREAIWLVPHEELGQEEP